MKTPDATSRRVIRALGHEQVHKIAICGQATHVGENRESVGPISAERRLIDDRRA
jgi:hypothetical protein